MDTANVMGARPDGWWRDRAGAAVRLHADLVWLASSGLPILPEETGLPEFVMVLEGAAKAASARIAAVGGGEEPAAGTAADGGEPLGTAAGRGSAPATTASGGSAPATAASGGSAPATAASGGSAPATAASGGSDPRTPGTAAGGGEPAVGTGAGESAPPDRVRVVKAPGSGDDAIVALVRELPGRRVVVTADRELRDRCVATGAAVLGPGWLLGLLRR